MVCSITPEAVFQLGIEMMGRVDLGKSEAKSQEDFVTQFGRSTSPEIVYCNTVSDRLRTTRKTSGMDDVLVFLRELYVGISIATWVAKVAQRYGT